MRKLREKMPKTERYNGLSQAREKLDRIDPRIADGGDRIHRSLVQPYRAKLLIGDVDFGGGLRDGEFRLKRAAAYSLLESCAEHIIPKLSTQSRFDETTLDVKIECGMYILTEEEMDALEDAIVARVQLGRR